MLAIHIGKQTQQKKDWIEYYLNFELEFIKKLGNDILWIEMSLNPALTVWTVGNEKNSGTL